MLEAGASFARAILEATPANSRLFPFLFNAKHGRVRM
jgi:hypothetical protein